MQQRQRQRQQQEKRSKRRSWSTIAGLLLRTSYFPHHTTTHYLGTASVLPGGCCRSPSHAPRSLPRRARLQPCDQTWV